jgi:site-specific DNA recombinase
LTAYIDGNVTYENYDEMNKNHSSSITSLKADLAILTEKDTAQMQFLKRGFNLISDISQSYKSYPHVVKEKVIGSIFPEKMIFDGIKLRTVKINKAVSIFNLKINGLEVGEKRKSRK